MNNSPVLGALANETALVQRLQARDELALRLLYERYADNLLAVIKRLVHDDALAQDVLQEGLLKVWSSIGSYDASRGRLYTWLARLCCNCAIDALRSARYRFHQGTQSLDAEGMRQVPAALTFRPEYIGVRELTLQLKPRQREVIDLLYFGGCTPTETAEELGAFQCPR